MAASNFYALSQLYHNIALLKPYIIYYISPKSNFENEINRNKVEDKVFANIKIKLIDYKRD